MTSFNLLKLPGLAFHQVVETMGIMEIIKLTMCSNRAHFLVKLGKLKVNGLHLRIENDYHQLEVNRFKGDFCDVYLNRNGEKKLEIGKEIEWYQSEAEKTLSFKSSESFDDVTFVAQRLRSCLKVLFFSWKINVDALKTIQLKDFLSNLPLDDCHGITVYNGSIDLETINYLMDTLKLDKKISISSKIPLEFRHEKAFRFKSCSYADTHWITMNNMLSLHNNENITLGRTTFECKDINYILKSWMQSDQEMFSHLELEMKSELIGNAVAIFEGLRALFMTKAPNPTYYLLAKNHLKKQSIGRVEFKKKIVEIQFLEYSYIKPLLILFRRRAELAANYENLKNMEKMEMEKRDSSNGEIKRIQKEKKRIEKEFEEIVGQLIAKKGSNFKKELDL